MDGGVCHNCDARRSALLLCAGCGSAQYCDRTCQKSDWKKHKKNCKPYKVIKLEGKGLGLLASKNIKQGELIIKEKAVMIIPFNNKKQVQKVLDFSFKTFDLMKCLRFLLLC